MRCIMNEGMKFVTCAICDNRIELIPDGMLRYCPSKCLGIDHTKEYTRYLGTIPIEHDNYEKWITKNRDIVNKAKLSIANSIQPCALAIDYSKWEDVKDMYAATYSDEWSREISDDSSDDYSDDRGINEMRALQHRYFTISNNVGK